MQKNSPLLEQFLKLSPFEQTLLKFLSITYEPAHTALIVNCLRKLDLKNPRGNKPTSANLAHYFTKFEQLGLLTKERQCADEIIEPLSKIAVKDGSYAIYATTIQDEAPVSYYYGKWTTRCWRAVREMRIGIYTQQFDLIDDASEFLESQCGELLTPPPPAIRVMTRPFDPEWFGCLPTSFQFYMLSLVLQYGRDTLTNYGDIIDYLACEKNFSHLTIDEQLPFKRLLFHELLFRARIEEAENLIWAQPELFSGTGAQGTIDFLSGKSDKALDCYVQDLEFLQKYSKDEKVAFFGPSGLFYILALIQKREKDDFYDIAHAISIALSQFHGARENNSYNYLATVINSHISQNGQGEEIHLPDKTTPDALTVTFCAICQYWLNSGLTADVEEQVISLYNRAEQQGFILIGAILSEILRATKHDNAIDLRQGQKVGEGAGIIPLLEILEPEEPWKRSLKALIFATAGGGEVEQQNIRLAWMVSVGRDEIAISPKEQKLSTEGDWSKGRPISLSRLYQNSRFTYLTSQDRRVCATIKKSHNPTTNSVSYDFIMDKALVALIGHPHLYLAESPGTPVEFVPGEPELLVEERGQNLRIRFAHPISSKNINFHVETPTRVKIISINDNHRRIAQITGQKGITVPMSASEEVLTAIGNISSFMTVHSAIAADSTSEKAGNITFVEADSTIYMHLLPYGTGFRLEMFVKPFAQGGHYLKPGQGVENIMAEVNGRRLQTKRNLALEEEKARDIEELCPILDLAIDMEQENDREWHLFDPDDCLQALLELQEIRDKVKIEWPEGEKLSITHTSSVENLNLKIRTNRQNWFAMSGELKLDQGKVIELKELLAKVKTSSGRFIEIGDGQFIALTQEFKKRLDEINLFSDGLEKDDSNEVTIHPLAAIQLEKIANRARTDADFGWKGQIRKISEAQEYKPELPSTLMAELRHYQREGYEWLARLAYWGVGGCLADDMGLGKTLQSLAIILNLASRGPSLVVAPTSVSTNWQTEVKRFTPTINIKFFSGQDRAQVINELGKFDLLITTYTLLQQESELLSTVKWQTVILDEAQAIKNSATKRSQAAMALNAEFKLITTGTPIENHLGELWNLFHFINPGLLGSLASFNERFAIPIEKFQDRDAKLKLKKLIRPFILRRIKSQVLEELPSRTEVTLEVEMSDEESLFYEALRQNAISTLENSKDKKGRHLQILTEIMRLRQACCNARLIDNNSSIASSKLRVFASVVEELLDSNHKALVFSQFIGHLSIIREYLDKQGIHYQYLDGTTSSKQRKKRVDAFQEGDGDLFLISLKAGGLGLNLTAADYVIHMDPWWNPAIEDQASDRAHRIGQTRPVTIYRLVCKHTIEEKIVKLHQEKRDLAGSLLEGADISAKMTSTDLLDLIKAS
ncbi:DEAD/DEAH box helicase [Desulforhopalus singaporensis]|uniref:Superfamily II DNA or RNA helicase, SNF2 family n=1 Tax=Desulforhopalus singaporensis TaxID=91360 RepID=A0A1H0K3Z3_9BACT|nr:DEAD/DEAH box helicase [Desulforhopalus singaporensis]SDO50577.1 Superfamily II DNA or RNA helicase, SNF2 family [Desulforhopalus singaporensis]